MKKLLESFGAFLMLHIIRADNRVDIFKKDFIRSEITKHNTNSFYVSSYLKLNGLIKVCGIRQKFIQKFEHKFVSDIIKWSIVPEFFIKNWK